MGKKQPRKVRKQAVYATTKGSVDEIRVSLHSQTGDIRFENEMKNVYSEISYNRAKGPKVLSQVPQTSENLTFSQSPALERNFDYICAVDTNSRPISGTIVSVSGIVEAAPIWVGERLGLRKCWGYDVPFCLEFTDLVEKAENFGWLAAAEHLRDRGKFIGDQRVGMVVDSDLGNLSAYNERRRPVCRDIFLPAEITLIYASGDVGLESIANRMLSIADSVSSQCLRALESGQIPLNEQLSDGIWCRGERVLTSKDRYQVHY